jgi:hypothetical protein
MHSKKIVTIGMIAVFIALPAIVSAATGCNKIKFFGSYTSPDINHDDFFDGSVVHSFVFQLNLNSDGTAMQYWTGLPEYELNLGSGSPQIGSWTCRNDGKLVVTLIQASFIPALAVSEGGTNPNVTRPDIELLRHSRTTYLFSVDDDNTLTKLQSRSRRYLPNADPTDPLGGTLAPINNVSATYKRLVASDADLVAP